MKIKYLEKRERKKGSAWVVNPPRDVQALTGLGYKGFGTDHAAAVAYANEVAAKVEQARRKEADTLFVPRQSVEGICRWYMTMPDFTELSPRSQRNYRGLLHNCWSVRIGTSNKTFGDMFINNVDREYAKRLHSHIQKERGETVAWSTVKVIRKVFNVALENNLGVGNPFQKLRLKGLQPREIAWDGYKHVYEVVAECDRLGKHSLGSIICTCFEMCQRPGDIRQLKWKSVTSTGKLDFVQEKTRHHAKPVRITMGMKEVILDRFEKYHPRGEAGPDDYVFTREDNGKIYSVDMLNYHFKEVLKSMGVTADIHIADLRRTGATEMANGGCSDRQIMAVTGHKTASMLNVYVRKEDCQADDALALRYATRERRA